MMPPPPPFMDSLSLDGTHPLHSPPDGGRGVLQELDFFNFFLLRTALRDHTTGPPTANHQPPPTASGDEPPTANHCQPPPTTNHQPPTTNHQPPTTNRRQPPTTATNRQSPPTANRQPPPTMVENMSYTRSFWGNCVQEHFFFFFSLLRTPPGWPGCGGGGVICLESPRRRRINFLGPRWSCSGKVRGGSSQGPWGDRRAFWGGGGVSI